jgi:CheY-like chemotaxis protein
VFSVIDTGIGIAPENLAVIFGAFQQGDGTLSRRYGGTGLGLSIASEVSALLGGQITATSDLGRGSTFTLYAPATLPESPPAIGEPAAAFAAAPEGSSWPDGLIGSEGPAWLDDIGHVGAVTPDRLSAGTANPDNSLRAASKRAAATLTAASVTGHGRNGRDGDSAFAAGAPVAVAARFAAHDRNVLVFEGTSGGLLTLLAYSAISDLAEVSATVRVSTATVPSQGVASLAAEPFRCVVVDLAMPTALEFLEQVQEKPELRETPVLAHLTGQPDSASRGRLAALRFSYPTLELLPSLDELRERITLHLSAAQPGRVPALISDAVPTAAGTAGTPGADDAATETHPGLRGKRVLVIDDDARNVFAITSTLELYGVRVTHASDGRHGVDALRADPETDLILMDIMMPGMDGYATMTAIRQMPQFRLLPIIAVTARAMPSDREKSLAAGASDHVTKPVNADDLLACMERWCTCS